MFPIDHMRNKKRFLASVALSAMLASEIALGANSDTKAHQFIADIESRLELPSGSYRLHEYVRHYKFYGTKANSKVEAIFIFGEGSSGIRLVGQEGLPRVLDGGCSVVNVVLTRAGKIVSVQCNGRS